VVLTSNNFGRVGIGGDFGRVGIGGDFGRVGIGGDFGQVGIDGVLFGGSLTGASAWRGAGSGKD